MQFEFSRPWRLRALSWFDLQSKFHFVEVPRELDYTSKGCHVKLSQI